jgi:hypothetical protein
VQPTLSLYQRYIEWFASHDVATKDKHAGMLESMRLAREA